jgi:hypothetical protein
MKKLKHVINRFYSVHINTITVNSDWFYISAASPVKSDLALGMLNAHNY